MTIENSGKEELARELRQQAKFLAEREPVYARALALLDDAVHGEFGDRLLDWWSQRSFSAKYERPLLLLAALRFDALCEGAAHPLHAALTGEARVDALTSAALTAALDASRSRFFSALRDRAVQTNETTRAVTWLWPAHLLAESGERRPLALVDMGTSAGLNLIADALPPIWIDSQSQPIAIEPRPAIALRLGFDLNPLDVCRDTDAQWLRACVWPSDQMRLSRLSQGIDAMRSYGQRPDAPRLQAASLPDVPAMLDEVPGDVFVLCVQTIVRDYLPKPTYASYRQGMSAFLRRRAGVSLYAELELDIERGQPGETSAALRVHFAPRGGEPREFTIARTHPHPRQLFVERDALDDLSAALAMTRMG